MIKAVLYDLGDVFFEAYFWRKWNYEKIVEMKKFNNSFGEFYDLYEKFLEPVYRGNISYNIAFDNFLGHLQINSVDSFRKLSFEKKKDFEDNRQLFQGVKETLKTLCDSGIRNVIITDNEAGENEIRKTVIEKYNINEFIYRVVSSKEVGHKKPAPQIFNHAINLLNLTFQDVLFVAHDEDEISGALSLGIKTVAFNNYLQRPLNSSYTISNFFELLNIVHQLNNKNG